MPKVELESIPQSNATEYPDEFADVVRQRWYRRLSSAAGISDFGVSHVVLEPGAWSARRNLNTIIAQSIRLRCLRFGGRHIQ